MALLSDLQRIVAWLGEHGATLDLAPPATEDAITNAEKALGFALPSSYRDFLLIHDGQRREQVSWLPCGGRFHPIAECVETWRYQQKFYEPSNPVVAERKHERYFQIVFHPRWLPIAGNQHWDGDNIVLDMNPAPKGREGQLLAFVTECDVVLIGHGLEGFLVRYVELIDAGAIVCRRVEGQSYEYEVAPADFATRGVYATRWDKLFDPLQKVKKRKEPKRT